MFESGAILQYLGRKTGRFYPKDERSRVAVDEWLFWQMANLGPKAGEANHFRRYAPEKLPYAIDRFANEMNRIYGVMNRRLEGRRFLARNYSIADIACIGWVSRAERFGHDLEAFPHAAALARNRAGASGSRARTVGQGGGGLPCRHERPGGAGRAVRSTLRSKAVGIAIRDPPSGRACASTAYGYRAANDRTRRMMPRVREFAVFSGTCALETGHGRCARAPAFKFDSARRLNHPSNFRLIFAAPAGGGSAAAAVLRRSRSRLAVVPLSRLSR